MHRSKLLLAFAGVVVVTAAWAGTGGLRGSAAAQVAPATSPTAQSSRLRLPTTTPMLRIDGEVAGLAPGASGTLVVMVDGVVQAEVAAAPGAFAVDVSGSRAAGMVSLEYRQPGVHFTSLLGSYSRLARLAGGDARLTVEECECARISAFSTALEHVADMLLGRRPRSDTELDNTVRRMGYDLDTATVSLVRLAADPALLPPGYGTGLALLKDATAFSTYLQEGQYLLLADPASALAGLPAAALSWEQIPDRVAIVGAMLDARSPLSATATVIERAGEGFVQHTGIAGLGGDFTGVLDDGALRLTPVDATGYTNERIAWCPSTQAPTDERWTLVQQDLRRQWASDRFEVWRASSVYDVSYPECPELVATVSHNAGFGVVLDLARARLLTSARRIPGRAALPVFCDEAAGPSGSPLVQCGYSLHAFARNGTGEIVDLGDNVGADLQPVQPAGRRPFGWQMGDDAAMHVDTGTERTRYWIMDGGDGAALGVVYVAEADRPSGRTGIAGYTTMIRASKPDTYTDRSALGAWGYGSFDLANRAHVDSPPPVPVRFVRDASGRSVQWAGDTPVRQDGWAAAAGRLYTTTYGRAGCVAPSPDCVPRSVRYFRPLARVGNRIHGIEEQYSSGGGTAPDVGAIFGSARPQIHQVRDMPGAGLP